MKIIIAGDYYSPIYEEAISGGFLTLGYYVKEFGWGKYFNYIHHKRQPKNLYDYSLLFQNKFKLGPVLKRINRDLLSLVSDVKPDLVFIYRGTHIYKSTIEKIKKSGCLVFGYNNDDPFSKQYPVYFWRHFKRCLKSYDYLFVYRKKNIEDCNNLGINNVEMLRSYYLEELNYFIKSQNSIRQEYKTDVVFIGHFENDGRDEIMRYLLENNIDLRIYGTCWQDSIHYDFLKSRVGEITPVYDEYNEVLNGAKIAVVFLSKLNRDTYTRRCFEIPAAKTMMISEYTDDLSSMFVEDLEAVYFRNKEELLEKIIYYLANPEKLNKISENGYNKLHKSGHEIKDRVRQIIDVYNRLKNE